MIGEHGQWLQLATWHKKDTCFGFETGSSVAQASLQVTMQPRMSLSSSCLYPLSAGMPGICHHTQPEKRRCRTAEKDDLTETFPEPEEWNNAKFQYLIQS